MDGSSVTSRSLTLLAICFILTAKFQFFIIFVIEMSITVKRIIILAVIVIVGFVLGRLAIRFFMNLMLGGTLFGGNFL